jgi:hypothetical protein
MIADPVTPPSAPTHPKMASFAPPYDCRTAQPRCQPCHTTRIHRAMRSIGARAKASAHQHVPAARSQQMKAEIQLWTIRQGITAALCRQCDPRGSVAASTPQPMGVGIVYCTSHPGADPSSGHRAPMLPVLCMALLYHKRGASARAGAAQRRSDGLRCFSAPVGASAPRRALISTIPHDRLLPGQVWQRPGLVRGHGFWGFGH